MRDFLLSWAYLGLALAVMFLAARFLLPLVLPFAIGAALAVIIEPAVALVERQTRAPRGVAVAVVLVVVLVVSVYLLYLTLATLVAELVELYLLLPRDYAAALRWTDELLRLFGETAKVLPDPLRISLENHVAAFYQGLSAVVGGLVEGLRRLPRILTVLLVSLVAAFFMSRDRREINRFLLGLLPDSWRGRVRRANTDVLRSILGLINAQLLLVGITALLTAIALRLAGVTYALVIGLAVGILDLLPIIGPVVIFLPWVVYAALTGQLVFALYLAFIYLAMVAVRSVIEPRVIGRRIGLHPLATLIALYLGIQLFGVNGVVIGPLVAIVLKALVRSDLLPIFPNPAR
ncbi:MAG: sporulation integral membrane protein YtvI [bacterium]|nr:sporulation integral membrane protein YtvI [bacterium]